MGHVSSLYDTRDHSLHILFQVVYDLGVEEDLYISHYVTQFYKLSLTQR